MRRLRLLGPDGMKKTLLMLIVMLGVAKAQDGSSELTPEKTASTLAGRMRVRCTDDNLRLYANATACADEREPESCRMVFTTPASSNPAARDPKCDNPLLKDLTDQCRRTCATCCEDPSYACQNDESGIVNCNQNMEKCGMAEFSAMMVKFCPATCGLCLAKKCKDQIDDCEAMKSLCTNEIYSTFMEHQCARTCGKCKVDESGEESEETTSTGGGGGGGGEEEEEEETDEDNEPPKRGKPPKGGVGGGGGNGIGTGTSPGSPVVTDNCVDVMKNCHRNKKFCHHPSYKDMMKKNCAKTCGYCKPKRGSPPARVITQINHDCKDNHPFCKGWAANGYCESEEYTEEEKKDKCAKTCGYC